MRVLEENGFRVIVLDNLVHGHRDIPQLLEVPVVESQVGDRELLDQLLSGINPATVGEPVQGVLHFADYAYVRESVKHRRATTATM